MKTYSFRFIVEKKPGDPEEWLNALFEAGGDDTTVSERDGVVSIAFDREAATMTSAILSSLRTLNQAGFQTIRMEVDSVALSALQAAESVP